MNGRVVGHYRILEQIGAGAMGEVFRARDQRLGRDVAIKFIRPASGDNPDHLRRFEQEARAAAALNHPNILAIYDVGFEGSSPYIVSELLQGKTLRQRLLDGAIPTREAAGYGVQIAQGLVAAHERHIVHRDLKPENLFLTSDGRVKILDFGVAKLQATPEDNRGPESQTTVTKHGAIIGTVAYMSPEQLRAKPVDHRSDLFSFGAILFEMLAGCRAFRGETEVDTMTAVLREEVPLADLEEAAIPVGYQDIVKHCVEKEPENRFQSAKDLAFALQTLSGTAGTSTTLSFHRAKRAGAILPWAAAAILAVTTVALALAHYLHPALPAPHYTRVTFEAGTVYSARFSPNGQSIVYSAAWNGKPTQLFSTVGNSLLSQPLEITDANLLGISRSNELALVVGGTHSGQLESIGGTLARAPLAGGAPREVMSEVRWADWNASGDLAVVHSVESHSRLEYPVGHILYESEGWISNIRFSPDGSNIAFMDHGTLWDNRGAVCVVDLSGHVRTLTRQWESEGGLAWRTDGKEIWFTAADKGNNLSLMAVDLSGKLRTLLDLPVPITLEDISPDGRVLVSLNSKRLAMGYTALGSKQDTDLSWHDWDNARDISPDGQFVLFEDASEAAGPAYQVVMRKIDGTLPVSLGEGSAGGMSPDGKWAISIPANGAPHITLLPIGPGQPRSFAVQGLDHINNIGARFLSDGQRIGVNGVVAGHAQRCNIIDINTGKAQPVTPDGLSCGAFSPDSRFLVSTAHDQTFAIYPIMGGTPRPIPNLHGNFVPVRWSQDGLHLYGYRSGEFPSRIYQVELATGKETVLQELRPGVPAGVVTIAPVVVSRDGKQYAYSYSQTLSVLWLISGLR
ncbi:MAG TPA: WD40 repeat domain-containing serine/threonine protein kinase [Candidatus Sulfotelmatobacter sp.]|nr:WD40 repeat domain-containing serine/threonine protein kinase [Candidatus Sulfotelmatobacter sp.]